MTQPRQVIAGRTYLVSRRCTQREFLLRPDSHVEQVFLYCLGEAAERFDVTVHAWMAMSNHEHLVVRDNRGNLPEFLAHLHKMIAKALNAYWRRWENFWATEQPNVVYLVEAEDRFRKLIYLLANPVAEHLVEHVADWPGASSYRQNLSGRARTVKRPRGFFRDNGPMPNEVTLRPERLEGFESLRDAEWSDMVARAVREQEDKTREHRKIEKSRIVGRKAVLRALHTDRPTTPAPRRGLRPHIACRNVVQRAQELDALRAFRVSHAVALRRWLNGERRVLFPAGTYRMQALGASVHIANPAVQ